jgi:peptidoglycan hydrolase-like protein with peptidoglycan-binding domain
MRRTPLLFALALTIAFISTPLRANASAGPSTTPPAPTVLFREHALPQDEFWDRLAQCETAGDWKNGGRYAGGLGIMTSSTFPKAGMGTWERFGGEEFAPSPDKATREQQIEIANRIAFTGWSTTWLRDPEWAKRQGIPRVWDYKRPAVGLGGWGCYKSKSTGKYRMDKPKTYYHPDPASVPLMEFRYGQKGKAVEDLQTFIGGLRVDGKYGPRTRSAHLRYLKDNGLPTDGVPGTKKVSKVGAAVSKASANGNKTVKSCPKWEPLLRKHGLPVKEFTYIMWRESRCVAGAIGWNYRSGTSHRDCKLAPAKQYKKCKAVKSYDSGLLQINSSWTTVTSQVCGSKWGDMTVLLKPECNIRVAKFLYEEGGGIRNWAATSGRS